MSSEETAFVNLENCVKDVRSWMLFNKLKLNDNKTEFIVIGTHQQLQKVSTQSLSIGNAQINSSKSARNIGAWFDCHLNMQSHISNICKSASYHLHNIRAIRKYLDRDTTSSLVHAFVSSKIDFCNSLLYGIPAKEIHRIQRIQNSAARLITGNQKFCHITPVLSELHWLPVKFRIEFKILVLAYKAIHGLGPKYLTESIPPKRTTKYSLRQNGGILLQVPRTNRTTLGDRAFAASAPHLWNHLPFHIRQSETIDIFKSKLKTFLYNQAYH